MGSPVAIWLLGWGRVGFRTRSPNRGLKAGFLAAPDAGTSLTFAQVSPANFATDLQLSWHHRPRMPAAPWSCLAFANNRLTLSIHSERLLIAGRSPAHISLMFPGS